MGSLSTFPSGPSFLGSLVSGKPNLFSISYDLRYPGQNYDRVIDRVAKLGGIRVQQSMWLMTSYASESKLVRDSLLPFIDYNDSLLVTRIVDISGWESNADVRAWIQRAIDASVLTP